MGLTRAVTAAGTFERPRLEGGALVGSCCAACGTRSWPARAICANCGSDDLHTERLPPTGTLRSYTVVWVRRGPFEPPYVLGQTDFGGGAVVFGHVRGLPERAEVPLPVRVVVPPTGDDPLDFWFEPEVP